MRVRFWPAIFAIALLGFVFGISTKPARGLAIAALPDLTNAQATGGLKEALTRGVSAAISETGRPGGFEKNPLIKIVFPEKLRLLEKGLRSLGMGAQVDNFEHSMNLAAEQAAPAAKDIFLKALREMTFEDAMAIVRGDQTAGTEYFKRKTAEEIKTAFRPIIKKTMASNGVARKFDALGQSASKLPFASSSDLNVEDYVLEKSVDGLFFMMGEEEKKIRTNPAAQVTPLLKTVFGKL